MLSSKKFDEKLQIDNFEELEKEFQYAKNFFEHLKDKIKCEEVEVKFPGFCFIDQEILLKFPTYKIRIINNKISHDELRELLKDMYNYKIYDEANVIKFPSLEPVHSTAIHCLESNLCKNTHAAEEIEKILYKQKIHTQRCVDSGLYYIPIKVDEEGYVTVVKR